MKTIKVEGKNCVIYDSKRPAPHNVVTKKFFTSFRAEAFAKVFIKSRLGTRDFGGAVMTEKKRRGNVTALFNQAEEYDVDAMFRLLRKLKKI